MQPINKHTVLAEVRRLGSWSGYIAPNKVNSGNINSGWHLGMNLKITIDRENNFYVVASSYHQWEKLEDTLSEFVYYNCMPALGSTVRFWK
jgi:hypothetical protein